MNISKKSKLLFNKSSLAMSLGVILSIAVALFVENQLTSKRIEQNIKKTHKIASDIEHVLENYIPPLQGITGLYFVSDFKLQPKDYRKYAESRNLYDNFPGALGFGFIRIIQKKDYDKYLIEQKKYRSDFNYRRLNADLKLENLDEIYVIETVEPVEINSRAIGLVVSDEANRKEAADISRATMKPAITKSIQLVQANKKEPGFLYYLPITEFPSAQTETNGRDPKVIGWAYAPILLSNIIEYVKKQNPDIIMFEILENQSDGTYHDLYKSDHYKASKHESENYIHNVEVAGQKWQIRSNLSTVNGYDHLWSLIVFGFGFMLSYIIFSYLSQIEKDILKKNEHIRQSDFAVLKATEEMSSQMTFLNTVLNSIPSHISYWDRDLKNRLTNKEFSDFWSLDGHHIFGFHPTEVFPEKIWADFKQYFEIALSGKSIQVEKKITVANGSEHSMLIKFVPDLINNNSDGVILVIQDISHVRELEKENQDRQVQLYSKAKLSMLGEMAAGIAHEINNPLAVINGNIDIIDLHVDRSEINPEIKVKIKKSVTSIQKTVMRIASIVRGLKSFARDSENDPYTKVEAEKIIESVLSLTQERAKKLNIHIEFEKDGNNPLIYCNAIQIEQVIMNLISNSMDAIQDLQEKWVEVAVESQSELIQIRITDSGPGIDANIVEKMMQPFFTTKEVGKGTGLGLSIASGIITKHGANFRYETNNGHTSFVIEFNKQNNEAVA